MKLFDKYFKPYAEYCLQTTFSEDKLKAVFEKELPHIFSFAAFKAGFEANKFTFFRRSKPFRRNTWDPSAETCGIPNRWRPALGEMQKK